MGDPVTVVDPGTDAEGFFPKGPATVCVETRPQRQCYTAPKDFGLDPRVETVEIKPSVSALLFTADSGGVSGSSIHFALLRLGTRKDLDNLFPYSLTVSNQSQHGFLHEATISDRKIFVTADFVWGNEGH